MTDAGPKAAGAREPVMEPYARHVLVCTGSYCSPEREGRALYAQLAALLQRENLLFGPQRVKRGEVPCLGVCAGGPIVVVYPEDIWYCGVGVKGARRILAEHIIGGEPVEDLRYLAPPGDNKIKKD